MLRQIRHCLIDLGQRPAGRLGALLMVVALVSTGIPSGTLHAHADAYDAHEHIVVSTGVELDVQHAPANTADPDGVEVLHSHDACIAVSALLPVPAMVADSAGLVLVRVRAVVAASPVTPIAPPYRPPIV